MSHQTVEVLDEGDRRGAFWRRFIVYFVVGLACAFWADWLPLTEVSKRTLTRAWGPLLTADYPTTGRDRITVMLMDDQDLRDYGETWPVPLGFHQRRLLEMLKFQPKAVFFDLVFLDDRKDPDLNGFIEAACSARRAGVPVFIASFANAGLKPSQTERDMLARTVDIEGAAMPCIEAAYMNLKIDGYDQSVWEYALDAAAPAGETHGAHGSHARAPMPSPAARLYQVDHVLSAHATAEPLALVWGTASDPANLEWLNNDRRPGSRGAPCRASWPLYSVLRIGKPGPPVCPYNQFLPLRTLKRSNGLDADQLQDAIGSKYIVYGTHLQSNADIILSPFHGRIAGAFVHAMALDNLLSFQGAPKMAGEFGAPWASAATFFIAFAVAVISALVASRVFFPTAQLWQMRPLRWLPISRTHAVRDTSGRRGRTVAVAGGIRLAFEHCVRWLLPRLMIIVLYLAVVLGLIHVSYSWLHLGPLVWIEYALFPIGMEFLHLGEKADALLLRAWRYRRGTGEQPPLAEAPAQLPRQVNRR